MFRKTIYIFLIFLFAASCGGTFDSVQRGLTGAKANSADEFLVEKKDPLILPPDFENLPTPDESIAAIEEISIFENTLESSTEDSLSSSTSAETSILKKIKSK